MYTVTDDNRNDQIDFNGTDRTTWTTNDVATYSGYNVTRTRTYVYGADNSTNLTLVSMTMTATSGLKPERRKVGVGPE